MKQILLSAFTFLGFAVSAQTITEANHAPMNGDRTYATYQCDSLGITPGSAGAAQTWNYAVNERLSILNTYTTATSSNVAYLPGDVSVSSAANNTVYYRSATTKLNYYGGDISINAYDLNVKYSSPAIFALYPMSLNSATTSITSGTVNLTSPFAVSQAFTGTCTILSDATGTLVLPAKTFTNVLRVVNSQTIIAGAAATVYLKNYDYYTPGYSKAPVFSIQTSTINAFAQPTSTQTIVYVQKNYNVVGVQENQKTNIELSVFPNPASSIVNFSTLNTDASKINVYDMTGKIIATEMLEMGKAKMNTANFASGVYMFQMTDKNNQLLKTGKFNVSK